MGTFRCHEKEHCLSTRSDFWPIMDKKLFLEGKSLRQISRETGKGLTTVRYWNAKYKLSSPFAKLNIPTDAEITSAILLANSLGHALLLLNRAKVGSNYHFLKSAISRLHLDTVHWTRKGHFQSKTKVPWQSVLVSDSPYALTSERRERLISEGLLPNKCGICNCLPEWNGSPLTLRLDHINGKHTDSRIENLRFVCPNCDSQLPTYCSKNRTYQRQLALLT